MAAELNENLPFEVAIEKTKHDVANAINIIGRQYGIPSSILSDIVYQIAIESKLNALQVIVGNYDISVPNSAPIEQPAQEHIEE